MLEHILIIDNDQGFILDSLECLLKPTPFCRGQDEIDIENIKRGIHFVKPTIIKYSDYDNHVFYVYGRPHKGGTIYKYEIPVKNKRIRDKFNMEELYCFGDAWAHE